MKIGEVEVLFYTYIIWFEWNSVRYLHVTVLKICDFREN